MGTDRTPTSPWPRLRQVLGDEMLAELLGIDQQALLGYATASAATPEQLSAKLEVLSLTVAELSGSYNDFGIRRWLFRPRAVLGGQPPAALLAGEWDAASSSSKKLCSLVDTLAGMGAT